jgi:hypothetical protein
MRLLFIGIVFFSLIASGIYTPVTSVAGEQNLLILYSSDVAGETEPCG